MLCVPPRAVDNFPRVVHPNGNHFYHRVRRGPCPRYCGEAQAQGTAHRQHHDQLWEWRVDRARQHVLHLGRLDFAFRARLLLLWIWKVNSTLCPTTCLGG